MNPDTPKPESKTDVPSSFKNWISLSGSILAIGSLFAFLFLVAMDTMAHNGNPYLGILTYIVAPAFLIAGLALIFVGWWMQRRQRAQGPHADTGLFALSIDFSRARDRRFLLVFGSASIVFLLLTAFGSYQTYHFTESVQFCGETCHGVMQPEYTTYQQSPHARVSCAECHIGSGASWYVKSKLSGAYQVYATIFNKYERPIPTPVANLRPAQDTCERCHWPEKFTGSLDRTYQHYLSDKNNTPYTVRLLLRVGGGQPGHGPFGGIHWHMNVANKVEYYAKDRQRQNIPWVRVTSRDGKVTIYRTPDFKGEPPAGSIRVMDCMDCHNHPAHIMKTANQVVEGEMATGALPTSLPFLKRNAVDAISAKYKTESDAMSGIAAYIESKYKGEKAVPGIVAALQSGYRENFFPEMKADWRSYPNDIGHKDWLGCFRCHDDNHVSTDGKEMVKGSDCNMCHVILSQGKGAELTRMAPTGLEFKHPGGELDPALTCSDCHNGQNQK